MNVTTTDTTPVAAPMRLMPDSVISESLSSLKLAWVTPAKPGVAPGGFEPPLSASERSFRWTERRWWPRADSNRRYQPTADISLAGRAQGALFVVLREGGSPGRIRTADISLAGRAQGALFVVLREGGSPGRIRTADISLED